MPEWAIRVYAGNLVWTEILFTCDILTELYRHFIPDQVEDDSFNMFNLICRQYVPTHVL